MSEAERFKICSDCDSFKKHPFWRSGPLCKDRRARWAIDGEVMTTDTAREATNCGMGARWFKLKKSLWKRVFGT